MRDRLRRISSKAWAVMVFLALAVAQLALDRAAKHFIPEGAEAGFISRAIQWARDMLNGIPTGYLLVAAGTALALLAWDERRRWIGALKRLVHVSLERLRQFFRSWLGIDGAVRATTPEGAVVYPPRVIIADRPPTPQDSGSMKASPAVPKTANYDVPHKLEAIDAGLGILRGEIKDIVDQARQLNNGWSAPVKTQQSKAFIQSLDLLRSRASSGLNRIAHVRQSYPQFPDVCSALLSSSPSSLFDDGIGALRNAIKMMGNEPCANFEWFINPHADKMRAGVTEVDQWRQQAEARLIAIRRELSQ